jgi:hypothetical protein
MSAKLVPIFADRGVSRGQCDGSLRGFSSSERDRDQGLTKGLQSLVKKEYIRVYEQNSQLESVNFFNNNTWLCNFVSNRGDNVREQSARKQMNMIGSLWPRRKKKQSYSACRDLGVRQFR